MAADLGYDNSRIYAECAERNVVPIIPLRKNQGYRESNYGLAFLRVRDIERVRLHADLTMLARLSLALSRARAVPLAA
jgi:hypothetical protein